MARFTGAETVKGGYYLNLQHWKLELVEAPSGALPGNGTERYVRIPAAALLVLAPLMGLAFVLLLPLIGVAVLIEELWTRAHAVVVGRGAATQAVPGGVRR